MDFTDIANAVGAANAIEPQGVPVVKGRRVHIDADMLAYQCGGNDETDVATSRRILKSKIDLFKDAAGAESILLHMTASGSTKGDRAVIAYTKPYQGQRKGRRPKNWQYLRDYMADGLAGPIKQWYDREADDGFGFISAQCHGDVIATRDKDMRMLPGLHRHELHPSGHRRTAGAGLSAGRRFCPGGQCTGLGCRPARPAGPAVCCLTEPQDAPSRSESLAACAAAGLSAPFPFARPHRLARACSLKQPVS